MNQHPTRPDPRDPFLPHALVTSPSTAKTDPEIDPKIALKTDFKITPKLNQGDYHVGDPALNQVVTGQLLGEATSRHVEHSGHVGAFAMQGERCFACRWFEILIIKQTTHDRYVVATVGGSIVPSERIYYRVHETSSEYEVLEVLTLRKPGREPQLTMVAARALAQAAALDAGIREAYIQRAVV